MPNTVIPQYTLSDAEEEGAQFGLAAWNADQKQRDPNHVDRPILWYLANIIVRPRLQELFILKYRIQANSAKQAVLDAHPPDVIPTS